MKITNKQIKKYAVQNGINLSDKGARKYVVACLTPLTPSNHESDPSPPYEYAETEGN